MSLEDRLKQYETDIKKLVNISPKQLEVAQVAHMVTSIPERKWNAADALIKATDLHKTAKSKLKTVKATKVLEANQNKDKYGSAEDRRAFAETHPDVLEAEEELIAIETELLAAKLGYECLDDLFTAGKKIMDFLTDQARATREYDRFANEAQKNK